MDGEIRQNLCNADSLMIMDNTIYTKEIMAHLKTAIKNDVKIGYDRNIKDYLDYALSHLKLLYRKAHKWDRNRAWKEEDRKDLIRLWLKLEPEFIAGIEMYTKEFKQKKMTSDIQMTTARVIVREAMQDAGLKHHFTGQVYRAKIGILITGNRALTVYIPYRKLNEMLPKVIESAKIICKELESLGNISIHKTDHFTNYI